jgi:hypothetical protein
MFRKKSIIIIAICFLSVITFLSYLPSLGNGFTNYDDDLYVTENKAITDISLPNIQRLFTSFKLGLYKPLVMLSFALEYHFFKLTPQVYHLTNLILHLINCLLVFWMIYLVCGRIPVAFITALLFGIHPMHVESVAWISERKDVLYSFFFLWAAICYLYYRMAERRGFYYLSLSAFFLSLLAKPVALILPFILLIFDFLQGRKWDKEAMIEKVPFFLLSAAFVIINIFAHYLDPNPRPMQPMNLIDGFFTLTYCIAFYLKKIFWPFGLSCIYSYPKKTGGFYPLHFYLSCVVIISLTIGIFLLRKKSHKLFFGSLFFLIAILPALRLIPIFVGITADRYTYIPYIGIFYCLGEGISWLYRKEFRQGTLLKSALTIVLIFVVGILSFLTFSRIKVWKDSLALWNNVVENYPEEPFSYYSLGLFYLKGNNPDLAIVEFNRAIQLRPDFIEARLNRAVIYSRKGTLDQAVLEYNQVIRYSSRCFEAYNNRGNIYGRKGRFDEAIADFTAAIKINPRYANAYYNRAVTYLLKKDYAKSLEDFRKAELLGVKVDLSILENITRAVSGQK